MKIESSILAAVIGMTVLTGCNSSKHKSSKPETAYSSELSTGEQPQLDSPAGEGETNQIVNMEKEADSAEGTKKDVKPEKDAPAPKEESEKSPAQSAGPAPAPAPAPTGGKIKVKSSCQDQFTLELSGGSSNMKSSVSPFSACKELAKKLDGLELPKGNTIATATGGATVSAACANGKFTLKVTADGQTSSTSVGTLDQNVCLELRNIVNAAKL